MGLITTALLGKLRGSPFLKGEGEKSGVQLHSGTSRKLIYSLVFLLVSGILQAVITQDGSFLPDSEVIPSLVLESYRSLPAQPPAHLHFIERNNMLVIT